MSIHKMSYCEKAMAAEKALTGLSFAQKCAEFG